MNEIPPASARVWFITGCSSGLGLALASEVLEAGGRVVATAREASSISQLSARFPETCRVMPLDVTDFSRAHAVLPQAADAFGRLDVVVNNAGYGLIGAFEELAREQIARNFHTNLFGALEVIRAALPLLRAQGSGHIVNISAAAAISNYPGFSIYGATKWALEGASESLAAELKPLGIKVMVVQPGPFRTDFVRRSLERGQNYFAEYEGTSGKFRHFLEGNDGRQPGDPQKAAKTIIAAVESDAPPFRLVLGKYAVGKLQKKLAEAERENTVWERMALATDFTSTP